MFNNVMWSPSNTANERLAASTVDLCPFGETKTSCTDVIAVDGNVKPDFTITLSTQPTCNCEDLFTTSIFWSSNQHPWNLWWCWKFSHCDALWIWDEMHKQSNKKSTSPQDWSASHYRPELEGSTTTPMLFSSKTMNNEILEIVLWFVLLIGPFASPFHGLWRRRREEIKVQNIWNV